MQHGGNIDVLEATRVFGNISLVYYPFHLEYSVIFRNLNQVNNQRQESLTINQSNRKLNHRLSTSRNFENLAALLLLLRHAPELLFVANLKTDAFPRKIIKWKCVLAGLVLHVYKLLKGLVRVQGDMLKDVWPSHVLVLDCHWVCLKSIDPFVPKLLDLLQKARLLFECLRNDDTDTDRVILSIFDFELVLFIFNLKKARASFIAVLDLDTIIFAKLMQNRQIDAFVDFNHLILQPILMILGLRCFQDDDDDLFKRDLSPNYLRVFQDCFMQDKLMSLRICLDY